MLYRILTTISLVFGLAILGCGRPSLANPAASSPEEKNSVQSKADNKNKDKVEPAKDAKEKKSAEEEKFVSLRDYLDKRHYKWPSEKESDFPLVIEMESPPVPEEIQGPFPENAPWRSKEKPEEKKPGKSFWPW
jgi:hypothetical protein